MTDRDIEIRNATYGRFVELGRAPTPADVASALGATGEEIGEAWRRLHEQHALVLNAGTLELRMANPFSAVPTAYRVEASGRWWYAVRGTRSASAPRCRPMPASKRRVPIAASRSRLLFATVVRFQTIYCFTVWFRRRVGGTTSSLREAR